MDQKQYEAWFGGTSMTRAKRQGLQRNALIALWATGAFQVLQEAGQILRGREGESELVLATLAELLDQI
jgi:epoxyqueuosine reductase